VPAGRVVVRKGQPASCMFFVADGSLEVELNGHHERLGTDFFGEIALLRHAARSATIRSLSRCTLLVLHASDFEDLLSTSPRIASAVERVARERLEADGRRSFGSQEPEGDAAP